MSVIIVARVALVHPVGFSIHTTPPFPVFEKNHRMFAPHARRVHACYRGIRQCKWWSGWLRLAGESRNLTGRHANSQREAFAYM